MGRPLPRPRHLPLLGRGHVYPDGSAYLEVAMQGVGNEVTFTRDQVGELEEIIASFKRFITVEDARPVERTNPYREAL